MFAARFMSDSGCPEDGFYAEEERQPVDGPKQKQRVIKKIPQNVIQNAKGLAIFTTMRSGLWMSGAGGSGILVGRLPDGSWSPPSGILLHTAGLGFLVGIDIYDCVVVINTEKALEGFMKLRATLGSEISVAAGPVGAGGILDTELIKRQAPIFTYLKSRGFYAGVQVDGTIIIERNDENERFYGYKVPVKDILGGKIRHPPYELRGLMETIKAAQGDSNVDESALPSEPPPGDYVVDDSDHFGIPDKEDPDPYGVMALEKEGLSLKEAGTQKRASWEEFNFNPAPSSPVHAVYARNSQDNVSRHNSWRASAFANEPKTPSSLRNSMDSPRTPMGGMKDSATQTEVPPEPSSPSRTDVRSGVIRPSSRGSLRLSQPPHMQEVPENEVLDTSPERKEPSSATKSNGYTTPPHTPPLDLAHDDSLELDDHDDAHIEEPVVHSIQTVQPTSPQAVSKARIVSVPKRGPPPKLPPRNPQRSGPLVIDASPISTTAESKGDDATTLMEHHTTAGAVAEHKDMAHELDEKFDEVKLDDNETQASKLQSPDEEEPMPNPWAKIEESRQKQAATEEATRMPGGFD